MSGTYWKLSGFCLFVFLFVVVVVLGVFVFVWFRLCFRFVLVCLIVSSFECC